MAIPFTGVAVIVTGLASAAVQVATTVVLGDAERWTEGSLAVQFEFTDIAVAAGAHTLLNAAKAWPLAGGKAP